MLYNGKPGWNLVGYVRFQPGGQLYTGALLNTSVNPPTAVSLDLPIPPDATDMELWFNNTDFTGCSVWDSRFGENYHYNVTSKDPLPPRQSVQYRAGAIASLEMVNVISEQTAKRKSSANTVETRLNILSWVKNVAFTKNVYVDIHVFDSSDNLILGETLGLAYAQPAGGGGDFFALDAAIYQSSTVRPEARKVQYRIYYEVNGQVFTDAFLHSLNLPQDTEAV